MNLGHLGRPNGSHVSGRREMGEMNVFLKPPFSEGSLRRVDPLCCTRHSHALLEEAGFVQPLGRTCCIIEEN